MRKMVAEGRIRNIEIPVLKIILIIVSSEKINFTLWQHIPYTYGTRETEKD